MKLTLPQQDVYFEQLLFPNDPICNIGAKIAINGPLQYEVLNKAYIALINQHDAYRSIVVQNQGEVGIDILPKHELALEHIDFSEKKNADQEANTFMQDEFKKPFSFLEKESLHKFILIKINEEFHYLFSVYHHIITDGWGTSLMFQRLVKNYNELIENDTIETEYPYTYTDFVTDDKHYFDSDAFVNDKQYWTDKFTDLPERFLEKIDDKIGTVSKSKRKELIIPRETYNQLLDIAKVSRSSTFHVILGILYLYFGRKHQNNDFAVGLPVLNRSKSIFKKTVGLFMGVSALRLNFDFENTFEELVAQIKQQLRNDYRHQRFPLGKLIQELDLFQEKDRLFNITLSYEKQNYSDHFTNTTTKVIPLTHQAERVALALYIREFDESEDVKIDFDYNVNYFSEDSITQVVSHFEQLITEVCSATNKKLLDYQYLTVAEQEQFKKFNETQVEYPTDTTLLSFFQDQVEQRPGHIAVQDRMKSYSYQELDMLSNRVAYGLTKDFEDDDQSPVAVLMHRSADLIVMLLGILKSGRAYIPLDPGFPKERLEYIVAHSKIRYVVTHNELGNILESDVAFINAEMMINNDLGSNENINVEIKSSDTAYIIYTSGSTGKPKGVEIGHLSLLNFLLSMQQEPGVTTDDILFSVTTQSFDISILEFFTPLISGATVYVVDKQVLENPLGIINQIRQVKPTIVQATPSFYQMLYNAGWDGDQNTKILCGGDLLSKSLAEKLIYSCKEVWNMYGPTETTIWSSIKKINTPDDASNIGKPIRNTTFYILDEYSELVPVGTPGNLYIGGDGLAKGYFKNRELTSEKFIQNPYNSEERIYDTGDVGKWNTLGEIEFLGRNDNQVKIRGYRIELGEIETKLNQLDNIKSSVVVAKKYADQEALLIAYVVPNQQPLVADSIIEALRKELPEYMVPYTLITLENFPLTPNKKVDRKSLAQRDVQSAQESVSYQTPKTELEIKVCKYFKDILGLQKEVSVTDNFFRLGGHSLNAVKLIGFVERNLGYQISLKTIFDYPTVRSLCQFLLEKGLERTNPIVQIAQKEYYPITTPQYAIWLAGFKQEKSIAYNMFTAYHVEGKLDKTILEKAFKRIIDKYEALRTNFVDFEGFPHQKIKVAKDIAFEIDQLLVQDDEIEEVLENYANQEFDLHNDTLLRVWSV